MEKKYTALRTIATIYKIIGGITAVITILIAIALCATSVFGGAAMDSFSREFGSGGMSGMFGGVVGGLLASLFAIINGGALALTFYAMGEGIFVLLALEENTRETAALLRQKEDL